MASRRRQATSRSHALGSGHRGLEKSGARCTAAAVSFTHPYRKLTKSSQPELTMPHRSRITLQVLYIVMVERRRRRMDPRRVKKLEQPVKSETCDDERFA